MGASPSVALSTESDVTKKRRHLSHIFCDSPSTAVSIRDAYLVQCKHSYISRLPRLPESTHELLCQKREEYFLGKDDNSPHVTAMQLFELKDEQYMNNKGQLRKRPALSVLTDFGRDKFEEDTLFYVCGRGARVMLRNKSTTQCGTVIDLECDMTRSKYVVRIDNTDEKHAVDLRPCNALPDSAYQYTVGQRLMILDTSSTSGEQTWVDATVVASFGKQHGSRHQIQAGLGGNEKVLQIDLNRFNHAAQVFNTVDEFLALRTEFFNHLRETEVKVVDAITGNSLDVKNQTVNISVSKIAGKKSAGYSDAPNMHGLAARLCAEGYSRTSGEYKAQPVLIRAGAGTGKTWGTQQLQFAMAETASFDGLPLLIPSQSLASLANNPANNASMTELIVAFINDKYKARPDWCRMLMQSLRLNAAVILFDGVDEAPRLKEDIQRLFTEDLVPKRARYLLTSRPDGVDLFRFERSFVILDLNPLNDEQVQFALDQQMRGSVFFDHLFAFRKLRKDQDELYYGKLAPKAATRRLLQNLGDGLDRFKINLDGVGKYDPKMRQRTLVGDRFIAVNKTGTYRSQTILDATAKLSSSLYTALDQLVGDSAAGTELEGMELETAVRRLSPDLFGPDNNEWKVERQHIRLPNSSGGPPSNSRLALDDQVEGNYGRRGKWFPAVIKRVRRRFRSLSFAAHTLVRTLSRGERERAMSTAATTAATTTTTMADITAATTGHANDTPITYDLQYDNADGSCLPEQKALFRIAKRLVLYTRRCNRDPNSDEPTTTKDMWHKIAAYTDELLEVGEALLEPFKAAIREAAGPTRQQNVHFAPLKDPVRIYEKSFDDYGSRFKDVDGIIPIACIIDVLRCSIVVDSVDDVIEVLKRMEADVNVTLDGQRYTLRLVRVKNKFSRRHIDASHYRNILINLQLCVDGSDVAVFAEAQLKVQSVLDLLKVHDSHSHYEYFRSLFRGDVQVVDPMIQKLFDFVEKVCTVPVVMSLLITVMRDDATDEGESETVGMPVSKLQLYNLAISVVLGRWNPSRAGLARTVLARIAQYMVLKQNSGRIFTAAHVEDALTADDERECWAEIISSAGGDEASLPLIKVLEHDDSKGHYQFKHLSFQEYLAAAETAHDFQPVASSNGERPFARSWFDIQDVLNGLGNGVQANFYEFIVALYQDDIAIDATDVQRSCVQMLAPSSVRNTKLLRALVTQSVFPEVGAINLDKCEWIKDNDLFTWTVAGSDVETISLRDCRKITNAGVARLATVCRDLKTFVLAGCTRITSRGLKDLCSETLRCNGLTTVDLTDCKQVTDSGIKALVTTCADMASIELSGCVKITNKILDRISTWKQLHSVGLSHCAKVSAHGISKMMQFCPSIVNLDLSYLKFQDGLLAKLKGDKLISLNISGCPNLTTKKGLMPFFKRAKSLTSVGLAKCPAATEAVVSHLLKTLKQLTSVDLGESQANSAVLARLSKQPGLTSLRLRGCHGVKDEVLEQIADGCARLTMVDIESCDNGVTDVGLAALITGCPKLHPDCTLSKAKGDGYLIAVGQHHPELESIDLRECPAVTDQGLAALATSCPKLHPDRTLSTAKGDSYLVAVTKHFPATTLDMHCYNEITDSSVTAVAKHCPGLTSLNLYECKKITDSSVTAVATHCPGLTSLNLYECKKITDSSVTAIATHCPGLTSLNLSYCVEITDSSVTAIAEHCPGLTSLDLRYCDKITDSSVTAVAQHCLGLTSLNLYECKEITDLSVMAVAEHCPRLTSLDLYRCKKITDSSVTAIAKHCPELTSMNLSFCVEITDSSVTAVAKHCPWLTSLNLSCCRKITDSNVVAIVKHCPRLTSLNLYLCVDIAKSSMMAVAKYCPRLTSLNLRSCKKITDSSVTAVAKHCPGLTSLNLYECKEITGSSVMAIAKHCPRLESLDLRSCGKIADSSVKAVAKHCPRLTSLDLSCKKITDTSVSAIAKHCLRLTSLNLCYCKQITNSSVTAVAKHCPVLTSLNLSYCVEITDTSVTAVAEHCPGLASLNLRYCDKITDSSVTAVAKHCLGLTSLNLYECKKITDASVTAVAKHCPRLTSLNLSYCEQVTDSSVTAVAENCPGLKSLHLYNCDKITDASVTAIAQDCPGLTSLDLCYCDKITESSVTAVAEHCPGLTSLNLYWCKKITDSSVTAVAKHCPGLTSLNLYECKNITDSSVTAVAKHCPRLTSLDLSLCDEITDSGVRAVAKHCLGLTSLNLSLCDQITDSSVTVVAKRCVGLTSLNLSVCEEITDSSVMAVAKHCPGLTSLNLFNCKEITDSSVMAVANHCPGLTSLDLRSCRKITDLSVMDVEEYCPRCNVLRDRV